MAASSAMNGQMWGAAAASMALAVAAPTPFRVMSFANADLTRAAIGTL